MVEELHPSIPYRCWIDRIEHDERMMTVNPATFRLYLFKTETGLNEEEI
jgi:hypothetical protein